MKKFTAPLRAGAQTADSPSVQMPTSNSGGTPKNPSRKIMTVPHRPSTNMQKKDSNAPAKMNEGTNTDRKAPTLENTDAGKSPLARGASGVTPESRPQPSTSLAPTSGDSEPHKNTARKSMPKPRAPNTSKPKKPAKPLTDKAYEDIFNKVLKPSPTKPESLTNDKSTNDEIDMDDISQSDLKDTNFETEIDQSVKMNLKENVPLSNISKKTPPNDLELMAPGTSKGRSKVKEPIHLRVNDIKSHALDKSTLQDTIKMESVSATDSDLEDMDVEICDEFMKMNSEDNKSISKETTRNDSVVQSAPGTSKSRSTENVTRQYKINVIKTPTQDTAEITESASATASDLEDAEHYVERAFRGCPGKTPDEPVFRGFRKAPEKSTAALSRGVGLLPSRKLRFDASAESSEEWIPQAAGENDVPITPVNAWAAKRSLDYDETPVTHHYRKKSTVMKKTADGDKENESSKSTAKITERHSSTSSFHSAVSDESRRSLLSDISNSSFGSPKEASAIRSANASQELTADDTDKLMPPASSHEFKIPLFKTLSQGRQDDSHSQHSSQGRQDGSHSQPSSQERQDGSNSQPSSQGRQGHRQLPPSSQGSTYSIPSSKLDTEGKMQWLLPRRMVGTWIQCNGCQKWRYVRDIHDPTVFPDRWYCKLSPDLHRKCCEIEEQPMNPMEEALMIWNDYAPGSIVWAKVDGCPWWPAIVDDDPDYFQFYWLDAGATEIPTQYHVVFFGNPPSRAWVKVNEIRRFNQRPSTSAKMGAVKAATLRTLETATTEAQKAFAMPQLERLRQYGMLTRFRGKFNELAKRRTQPTADSDSE